MKKKSIQKVAITGAAGQIAYSLVFRIAKGDLLGFDQPLSLHLLDLPKEETSLKGLKMELEDCAFPLLKEIHVGSDSDVMFEGVDYALLVGAKPRGPGMERKDLLVENGHIFKAQGQSLNRVASRNVKVLVVGNPCNTNCLIALHHAPDLSPQNFFAMTRLDQNRACFQLAQKANVQIEDVKHMTIWGNHSSTQVPDFVNATIQGHPVKRMIQDATWLETVFVETVQKRGAEVIATRGKSSAASAANGILDTIFELQTETDFDDWFSMALLSSDNPYGIPHDLICSFPCRWNGKQVQIVPHLKMDPFLQTKIECTVKELQEERDLVSHLLKR